MEHIIYEDSQILLVYKPAGISVQTRRIGEKDLVSILKNERAKKGEDTYIAPVHRIDQPVEGLVLFAKTKQAAANLSRQLTHGQIEKGYRVIVYLPENRRLLEQEKKMLTDFLIKDGRSNMSKAVSEGTAGAKKAVLEYTVEKVGEKFAELSIRLFTGRHHQIRAQMANYGMPLAGDRKYGNTEREPSDRQIKEIALCAFVLTFRHPKNGKKMKFEIKPRNPVFQLLSE